MRGNFGPQSGGWFSSLPPVTKNLIVINFIIFLVALLSPEMRLRIEQYGALHYFTSPGFKPWQLISYMFIQFGWWHLFFNMFGLFMFGRTIEQVLGSARFLTYYLGCGIGAALIQEGVFALMINHYSQFLTPEAVEWLPRAGWEAFYNGKALLDAPEPVLHQIYMLVDGTLEFTPEAGKVAMLITVPTVGASGCIYGILLAFGMFFPNVRIYLYFAIPVKAKWLVIGYGLLELAQGLGNRAGDDVAHFAHLGGMLVGLLMILYWKSKGTFKNGWYF